MRETITMGTVGAISAFYGITHYLDTGRLDIMSVVMGTLSVLYFVALATTKEEK